MKSNLENLINQSYDNLIKLQVEKVELVKIYHSSIEGIDRKSVFEKAQTVERQIFEEQKRIHDLIEDLNREAY